MRKRFKNSAMQNLYAVFRVLGANKASEFWLYDKPSFGTGHRSAYWSGFNGEPCRYRRTSLAHAAWAAGQDNEKAGR